MIIKFIVHGSKFKVAVSSLKFLCLVCSFTFYLLPFAFSCYAEEITVLYTGETHAMVYPCNCPHEPGGGIARRATLIKESKVKFPNTLVLDSGGFFAGGLMDEYTQNTDLDKERTKVNLKAMELMQYDAVAIGDDEFNFGKEFFMDNAGKASPFFLSCNLGEDIFSTAKVVPYLIKEMNGIKIGIIGVTNLSAVSRASGLKFVEPVSAVKAALEELKKQGANIVVLLSHLGEDEDLRLIEELGGIDILVTGHSRGKEEPLGKVGPTIILRPSWQGRRLGKLSLTIKDNRIIDYKVEELLLSDKISDEPDVLAILPRCFSDANCKKEGLVGTCFDPGKLNSRCLFSEPTKINLFIITPKSCRVCNTDIVVNQLKTQLPGLTVSYLYYPESQANKLIKELDIKSLPVYLFDKETAKDKTFANLKEAVERKGDFYILKPQISGLAYFLNREDIRGRLDLFISLYDGNTAAVLDAVKEFNPVIHFLAVQQQDKFDALGGNLEAEEYLRSVCVQKYYPQNFWDYIGCRVKSIDSSWWQDCLGKSDAAKIETCARSEEGKSLLEENIRLNKELEIMFGPTYLLDNLEIFSTKGAPAKEELRKIIKRP